jgi:hypothetical protein
VGDPVETGRGVMAGRKSPEDLAGCIPNRVADCRRPGAGHQAHARVRD